MSLKTKCVQSSIDEKTDGLRILTTRFRGRGLKSTRYDLWLPALGPSESLLKSYTHDEINWREFSKRYREEIWSSESEVDHRNASSKNHGQKSLLRLIKFLSHNQAVTLMCHCAEDATHCHRHLLKALIESNKVTI